MPGKLNVAAALMRFWNAPDRLRIMDPLPSLHRKGIIIAVLLIIAVFLWPVSKPEQHVVNSSAGQREIQTEPASAPPTDTTTVTDTSHTPAPFQNNDIEQQWHTYQIASGKTLAQLFRDHNLPVEDVYAMAKVEGNDKPLSSLQSDQTVRIRQNASGVVTGLTVTTSDNREALFTRQSDGTFMRLR